MNKDKIREEQVLLDKRENYESLALPMVTETSQRVKILIKALYHGNYIDEMTEKWLSLTPLFNLKSTPYHLQIKEIWQR